MVPFSTSDIRFKENVTPIQDGIQNQNLKGVEFDWKPLTKKQKKKLHGNEGHDVGVIQRSKRYYLKSYRREKVDTRSNTKR